MSTVFNKLLIFLCLADLLFLLCSFALSVQLTLEVSVSTDKQPVLEESLIKLFNICHPSWLCPRASTWCWSVSVTSLSPPASSWRPPAPLRDTRQANNPQRSIISDWTRTTRLSACHMYTARDSFRQGRENSSPSTFFRHFSPQLSSTFPGIGYLILITTLIFDGSKLSLSGLYQLRRPGLNCRKIRYIYGSNEASYIENIFLYFLDRFLIMYQCFHPISTTVLGPFLLLMILNFRIYRR